MATVNDARAILEIYRPYVLGTAISFETTLPTLADIEHRITETLEKFPWLIVEGGAEILGYAYAGPYRSRSAYSWSVESTVYVNRGHHSKGIGKTLYRHLIEHLKSQGVVNVIGVIALPNEASVKLHESPGFEKIAHFKDIGFKLDKWWDVGFWQNVLAVTLQIIKIFLVCQLSCELVPQRIECLVPRQV